MRGGCGIERSSGCDTRTAGRVVEGLSPPTSFSSSLLIGIEPIRPIDVDPTKTDRARRSRSQDLTAASDRARPQCVVANVTERPKAIQRRGSTARLARKDGPWSCKGAPCPPKACDVRRCLRNESRPAAFGAARQPRSECARALRMRTPEPRDLGARPGPRPSTRLRLYSIARPPTAPGRSGACRACKQNRRKDQKPGLQRSCAHPNTPHEMGPLEAPQNASPRPKREREAPSPL